MQKQQYKLNQIFQSIEKYPAFALQVVSNISESDLENDWFHWYGAQKDFDYEKIHPDVIKAFMASKKLRSLNYQSTIWHR